MSKINSRAKGAAGEREFCKWLYENFDLEEMPTRNLDQVRDGGADVIVNPFAFEVKRCEKLELHKWWAQVTTAVAQEGIAYQLEPVVAYRQNKGEWNFLISARHLGLDKGFIKVGRFVFKKWVKLKLSQGNLELGSTNQLQHVRRLEK